MTLSILAQLTKLFERSTGAPKGVKYSPKQFKTVHAQGDEAFPFWEPTADQLAAAKSSTGLFSLWKFVLAILDQGQEGSCTANGYAGAYALSSAKKLGHAVWLSRQYLYWYERLRNGNTDSDAGAYLIDGEAVLSKRGAPLEEEYKYSDDSASIVQRPPATLDASAAKHKIVNGMQVRPEHIKARLLAGFPVPFGFTVFASFESASTSRTGVVKMPTPGEEELGGHCIYFIGHTGSQTPKSLFKIANIARRITGFTAIPTQPPANCYIAVNSWSAQFGDGGRVYMPDAFVQEYASDFYTFDDVTEV
jgi:C1A family cysteine protease